jgi:hypothetical protein
MAWQPSAWPLLNDQDPHTGYMMQVRRTRCAALPQDFSTFSAAFLYIFSVTLSQAALKAGRRVDCVVSECRYYDCGTRSEYAPHRLPALCFCNTLSMYLQLASELWHQIESRQ